MTEQAKLVLPDGQSTPAELTRVGTTAVVAPGEGGNRSRSRRETSLLPVLLAGPILRRSEPSHVMVWVATSAAIRVTGEVLDPELGSSGAASGNRVVLGRGEAEPIQIGQHLFLTMLTITPTSGTFRTGRILTYDLTFHAPRGYAFTSGGLLPRQAIAYGSLPLPSFILDHAGVSQTHLIHASCRKLHGLGRDTTTDLDAHIRACHTNASTRPRFLLLTGDQIYADDVSPDILRPLERASRLLLGFRETLPRPEEHDPEQYTDSLGSRARLVRQRAHLTVDESVAACHLLGFGEFAAMYLLNWSPALWDAPGMRHPPWGGSSLPDGTARSRNYDDVVAFRRALANVPTYMQLDDHEISDDWPMDLPMTQAIDGSQLGKWIVANGLAACWLFQLQGNGIGDFPCLSQLRSYLNHGRALASIRGEGTGPEQRRAQERRSVESFRWRYVEPTYRLQGVGSVLPTVPPVVMLDTRTQRHLGGMTDAPGLLSGAGRAWLRNQLARVRNLPPGTPLLVVSPAPVIADPQFDTGQEMLASAGAQYRADREGWSQNTWYFRDFLRTLALAQRKVVVFSGDVHFGYTASGTFRGAGTSMTLLQLTSSAMRNRPAASDARDLHTTHPWDRDQTLSLPENWSLDYRFHDQPGIATTLVTTNNIGIVELRWNASAVTAVHELRGEGQSGTVNRTI